MKNSGILGTLRTMAAVLFALATLVACGDDEEVKTPEEKPVLPTVTVTAGTHTQTALHCTVATTDAEEIVYYYIKEGETLPGQLFPLEAKAFQKVLVEGLESGVSYDVVFTVKNSAGEASVTMEDQHTVGQAVENTIVCGSLWTAEMKSAVIGPWKWGNDFRRMITISPNEGLKSNLEIMNSQNYGFVVITDDMIGKEIDLMESSVITSFNAVGGANSGIPSSLSGQISSGRMLVNVDDNGFTMEMDFLVTDLGETVKIRVSGIHQEPEAKSDAIILGREGFGLSKSAMIDRDGVIEIYLSNANLANLDQFLEENTHPYVKVSFDASLIGTAIDLRSAGANNSVQFANYGNELDDIAGFAGWTSATLAIEDSTDYSDNKIYKVSFDGVDADGKALFVRGSCIYENASEE